MASDRGRDLLFCVLALAGAGGVLIASFRYQPAAAFFPRLLALFIAVCAVAFGFRRLMAPPARLAERAERPGLSGFVKIVPGLLVWTGALRLVGFPVATVLFLTVMPVVLGERRLQRILPVAIGLTGLLYGLFFRFLGVYPPESWLTL